MILVMEILRWISKAGEWAMDEVVLGQPTKRLTDLAALAARKERGTARSHRGEPSASEGRGRATWRGTPVLRGTSSKKLSHHTVMPQLLPIALASSPSSLPVTTPHYCSCPPVSFLPSTWYSSHKRQLGLPVSWRWVSRPPENGFFNANLSPFDAVL
jgi:hypothetical protein